VTLPLDHPLNSGTTTDSALVQNLRVHRTKPLPVWFMRQAGRSLPEYRKIRETAGMLESCLDPALATEITLQPVRRHGVDAAIFFSDIVIPLKLAGVPVDIKPGVGPVIENPVRTRTDLANLQPLHKEALAPITAAITLLVKELGNTPLIGFGGAPFTLASYLIEGGPSKDLPHSRDMMVNNPDLWRDVLTWCAEVTAAFIRAQVTAGASALQVFDSWAGRLSSAEYRAHAAPYSTHLFSELRSLVDSSGEAVPRIHFGVGTTAILPDMLAAGATALGVDAHTTLAEASAALGHDVALQGNIDSELLGSPWEDLEAHVRGVLVSGQQAPGHVVNLGHGVPPDTNPAVLTRIVELVHEATQ
jgi:uroporphyrinogen decarboxylase